MGHEARRFRRYDVADVRGSLLLSLDARILNMSLTGMAIETGSVLKVGGDYWLRLAQPGGAQLRFKTNVKWCRLVRNERDAAGDARAVYQAGLDFRDGLDENARQVLSFLEQHIVVELDRRLTGRFSLAQARTAALAVRHDFEVRRLSLGGMLVETVWDPALDSTVELEVHTGKAVVRTSGKVRSVLPAIGDPDGPPTFAIGLEFVGLAAEDQRSLAALLESLLE
jgi:PilZ domain